MLGRQILHLISVVGQSHTHILCQKYFTGPGILILKGKPTGYSSQKDLITIHNSILVLQKNVIKKYDILQVSSYNLNCS